MLCGSPVSLKAHIHFQRSRVEQSEVHSYEESLLNGRFFNYHFSDRHIERDGEKEVLVIQNSDVRAMTYAMTSLLIPKNPVRTITLLLEVSESVLSYPPHICICLGPGCGTIGRDNA